MKRICMVDGKLLRAIGVFDPCFRPFFAFSVVPVLVLSVLDSNASNFFSTLMHANVNILAGPEGFGPPGVR